MSSTDPHLLKAIQRAKGSLEALCDDLDCSPRRARQLLGEAKAAGLAIEVDGGSVKQSPPQPVKKRQHITFAKPTRKISFAVVTDTHFGSKYARTDCLSDFVHMAYERGVRDFLHCGDVLDGSPHMHRGIAYEQDRHGLHAQCMEALDSLPMLEGARYAFITGNHDASLYKTDGADVGRTLIAFAHDRGRNDLAYLGPDRARLLLGGTGKGGDGLAVDLQHPGGAGGAKNMSLKLRNLIDGYASGNKPQVMLLGHHHQYCAISFRRVHAFACPAFQDQTPFMRSKAIHPTIGGLIFDVECADDWSVRSLRHQLFEYPGRGYE